MSAITATTAMAVGTLKSYQRDTGGRAKVHGVSLEIGAFANMTTLFGMKYVCYFKYVT